MTTPKKKILPKTNTGDIIEGFGPAGGPRGVSRSAKIKEVQIKPKKSLQNQKVSEKPKKTLTRRSSDTNEVRSFSKDEMAFMDDIMTHGIKGKSPNPNAKVLNPDLKITKWQGKLGPEPNPLPSSHYRKIANIKNRKQDTINKLKVKKKK